MTSSTLDPRVERGMRNMLTLRQEKLDAGEESIGWKVGFGSKAALEKFELDGPMIGYLTTNVALETGATISVNGWKKGAVEAEIAVHIGKDLPDGADREATIDAIVGIGSAIEVADVSFAPEDVEEILSDNIYNRYVLLGKPDLTRAGGDLNGLVGHVYRNNVETATVTDFQEMTGDYIDVTAYVANMLVAFGHMLKAGDVIIMGAVTPHLWLEQNEEIRYELEPGDMIRLNVSID